MQGLKRFNAWARSDSAYYIIVSTAGFYLLVALYSLVQS